VESLFNFTPPSASTTERHKRVVRPAVPRSGCNGPSRVVFAPVVNGVAMLRPERLFAVAQGAAGGKLCRRGTRSSFARIFARMTVEASSPPLIETSPVRDLRFRTGPSTRNHGNVLPGSLNDDRTPAPGFSRTSARKDRAVCRPFFHRASGDADLRVGGLENYHGVGSSAMVDTQNLVQQSLDGAELLQFVVPNLAAAKSTTRA